MISITTLMKALKAVIPYLPKGVQRLMPGVFGVLPLAFEIANLLYKYYKHRQQTSDQVRTETQDQVRKETQEIEKTIPHLPKGVGRWLRRRLAYLPLGLELAKAFSQRNFESVRSLITPLPSEVKRKIGGVLRRYRS